MERIIPTFDWRQLAEAIEKAYAQFGFEKEKTEGGQQINLRDWNIGALVYQHAIDLLTKTVQVCYQCKTALSFNTVIRCLDCRAIMCEVCAKEHFGKNHAARAVAAHTLTPPAKQALPVSVTIRAGRYEVKMDDGRRVTLWNELSDCSFQERVVGYAGTSSCGCSTFGDYGTDKHYVVHCREHATTKEQREPTLVTRGDRSVSCDKCSDVMWRDSCLPRNQCECSGNTTLCDKDQS
jgi:hypothetical protein